MAGTGLDQTHVTAGKPMVDGGVYYGPVGGKEVPKDVTSALPTGYVNAGYILNDGVSNALNISSSNITAWGGDLILSPLSEYGETYSWSLAQTDATTLGVIFETKGSDAAGLTVKHNRKMFDVQRPFVVCKVYSDGRISRTVIPNGKITAVGEIASNDSSVQAYQLTVTALPVQKEVSDGSTDWEPGDTSIEYISAPNAIDTVTMNKSSLVDGEIVKTTTTKKVD